MKSNVSRQESVKLIANQIARPDLARIPIPTIIHAEAAMAP